MTGQLNSAGRLSEVTLFGRAQRSVADLQFNLPEVARFIDRLFAASEAPDADRVGDGLECLLDRDDDGFIDAYCDGDGGGDSVALRAELVPATLYPLP